MISYNFVKAITIFSFEYSNNKKNIPLVLVVCCPQPKTPTSLREPNVWFYNKSYFGNKVCDFKGYILL